MKGVDVSLFQFNWNIMFYAVAMNADGTIYARYGSPDPNALTTPAFATMLKGALEAHEKEDKSAFKAKRGDALKWKTPEAMPALARYREAKAPAQCVHCHHVWTGVIASTWQEGRPMTPQYIWPYPKPEAIGLTLDLRDNRRVSAVAKDSPAGKAGVRAGDELDLLGGQMILSAQDVEWVLHNAPDTGKLEIEILRSGQRAKFSVELAKDWRRTARRPLFGVVALGMKLVKLGAEGRAGAGAEKGRMALRVANLPKAGPAAAAGFKIGDVIVAANGRRDDWEDDELVGWLRMNHTRGAKIRFDVMREGHKAAVTLELR